MPINASFAVTCGGPGSASSRSIRATSHSRGASFSITWTRRVDDIASITSRTSGSLPMRIMFAPACAERSASRPSSASAFLSFAGPFWVRVHLSMLS
jgi:hypothetical protein